MQIVKNAKKILSGVVMIGAATLAPVFGVAAQQKLTSPNFTIDASVGNTFGGTTSSANYRMVASGGEPVIGNGTGGSHLLGEGYVAQLQQSMQLSVQPSGLAAYYPMDEGVGTRLNDSSANDHSAPTVGNPTWLTSGKVGKGLSFDGATQYATIPHSTDLNLETLTISMWIKTSQTPAADATIVDKRTSGAYPYVVRLLTTGKAQFAAYDGTTYYYVNSAANVNDGSWHHIAGVRQQGSNLKIYVDGQPAGEAADTSTAGTTQNTSPIYVGARNAATNAFNGEIDELKIFSRTLTANEVKADYDAGAAGNAAGMAFADSLVADTPQATNATAIMQTDAPGYSLALSQNANLTSGVNTISAIDNGGTIGTPVAWTDGTTKGLGFTLTAGLSLPGKWGTNPNYAYAAVPGSSTTFYSRSGYTGGVKDSLSIQYKVDIPTSQAAGNYTNTVTYTGTLTP